MDSSSRCRRLSSSTAEAELLRQLHATLAPLVVAVNGLVGALGLIFVRRAEPPRWFMPAVLGAFAVALVQVGIGVALLGTGDDPGSFHTFYGVVIAFTAAFAYIYRSQLARRPMLGYSLVALFVMGLALRGWANVGVSL